MYQWKDDGYYRGQWRGDRMNGIGRLVKDGTEVVGEFFADKLVRGLKEGDQLIDGELRNFLWSDE